MEAWGASGPGTPDNSLGEVLPTWKPSSPPALGLILTSSSHRQ